MPIETLDWRMGRSLWLNNWKRSSDPLVQAHSLFALIGVIRPPKVRQRPSNGETHGSSCRVVRLAMSKHEYSARCAPAIRTFASVDFDRRKIFLGSLADIATLVDLR
jgi:hypothetical protein